MRIVGLVRDDPLHIIRRQAGQVQGLAGGVAHHARRKAEDLAPVHVDELPALAQRLFAGRVVAAAAGQHQQVAAGSVRMHDGREHAAGDVAGLQHERARPVAEEDAGLAVLPVHKARKRLGPDDQRVLDAIRCGWPARPC